MKWFLTIAMVAGSFACGGCETTQTAGDSTYRKKSAADRNTDRLMRQKRQNKGAGSGYTFYRRDR